MKYIDMRDRDGTDLKAVKLSLDKDKGIKKDPYLVFSFDDAHFDVIFWRVPN